ncbi:Zinc finger MYM-type protein 1, partial [Frankliniella fusca]
HAFPKSDIGGAARSFHSSWYFRKLSDGSLQRRPWLSYSVKTDSVYCLDCILFGKAANKRVHPQFSTKGFCNWKNGLSKIIGHETSDSHLDAAIASELRKVSLPLDQTMKENTSKKRAENRKVVRQLIDVTLFLAQHCMAFRGHSEGKTERFRGNFFDLASSALATYLDRLQKSKKKIWNFMSNKRQNLLIKAISEFIRKKEVQEINDAVFFSVSFDESVDSSRKEQCTCIIKYVRNDTRTVAERLVAVKACAVTSGEKLFEVLKSIFEELQRDWTTNLVGQAYDGASNMRGPYLGLQALVRAEAKSAVYVWCWAHRLSLAVKEAAGCCLDAGDLFANLKKVYNVINGSKNNVDTYEEIFKKTYPGKQIIRLKRVDTTRWMSHSFALSAVLRAFEAIVETLEHIKTSKTSSNDNKLCARGLLEYFMSEKFVLTALNFESIYNEVEPLSTSLQGADMDLMAAVNHVDIVLNALRSLRSEESFAALLTRKDEFIASSAFVKEAFTALHIPTVTHRTRGKKKQDGERADDEPILDTAVKFRVETFYSSLDSIITLISERFNDRAQSLYKDLALLSKRRMTEVEHGETSLPEDAFAAFSTLYSKFLNADQLQKEYKQFVKVHVAYEKAFDKLPQDLHDFSLQIGHMIPASSFFAFLSSFGLGGLPLPLLAGAFPAKVFFRGCSKSGSALSSGAGEVSRMSKKDRSGDALVDRALHLEAPAEGEGDLFLEDPVSQEKGDLELRAWLQLEAVDAALVDRALHLEAPAAGEGDLFLDPVSQEKGDLERRASSLGLAEESGEQHLTTDTLDLSFCETEADEEEVGMDGDELSCDFDQDVDVEEEPSSAPGEERNARQSMKNSGSLANILYVVHNTGLKTIFPSLYIALKIAVTLPVTSASTERSFSKLKLIKHRLRSTMGQDRLEDLMVISCERDIEINAEEVLKFFSCYSKYLLNNL